MTEKLTLYHLNTELTFRGGEMQTLHLIRALNQRGHRNVLVAQPGSKIAEAAIQQNIECMPMKMRGEWDWIAARKIRGSLERDHPDILHAHTAHACSIAILARKAPPMPRIVYSRRVSFGGRLLVRKMQNVDAVIAVSESVRQKLLQSGVPAGKIYVAESGTDFSMFDGAPDRRTIRAELKLPESAFVVGNISYFKPEKGQLELIRAFCKFAKNDCYLLLVGDGPERVYCERAARESPCSERILFTGYREYAFRYYAAIDVFFFSSLAGEGWSGVLREAMGVKVPVIAVRQAATEEQVTSGLLVSSSEQDWIDAMNRMYEDPSLRREVAEAAFASARKFSIEAMVDKTEECYYRIAR